MSEVSEAKVVMQMPASKSTKRQGRPDQAGGRVHGKFLKVRQDLTHFGELPGVPHPWAMGVESHGKEFELHPKVVTMCS